MVLFYSTFVALKRQDSAAAGSLPTALIEDPRDMEEELLFSGVIRDRDMFHVLRLLQDLGSGVLRLEARSYRGDKDEVPIWTAFLTKYKDNRDRDIFNLESRGVVSMICPKPKPYIFVPEYGLPLMSDGNFALQFVRRDGEFHAFFFFSFLFCCLAPCGFLSWNVILMIGFRCCAFDRDLDWALYVWEAILMREIFVCGKAYMCFVCLMERGVWSLGMMGIPF